MKTDECFLSLKSELSEYGLEQRSFLSVVRFFARCMNALVNDNLSTIRIIVQKSLDLI